MPSTATAAGPGRFRGGAGVVREYEVLAEHAVLSMRIDSVDNPPWGVAGGMQGGTGRAVINPGTPHERKLAPLSDGTVLRCGDILLLETGGGGGHGHPFDRPAERVLRDVRNGFVSIAAARRDYGVVIAGDAVDHAGDRRAARHATGGEGVPSQGLCRCHRLTWPSRSISAARSPTSRSPTVRPDGCGAPRRRARRPIRRKRSSPA